MAQRTGKIRNPIRLFVILAIFSIGLSLSAFGQFHILAVPGTLNSEIDNSGAITEPGNTKDEDTIQMSDIHDIKPLEEPEFDFRIIYLIAGIICFLILCLWALYYFFSKRKKKPPVLPLKKIIPSHISAFNALDKLALAGYHSPKQFYFQLTFIIREYIQGRYGINAPEMTTEEFLPYVNSLAINDNLKKELRNLFRSTDPVKFAEESATTDKMKGDFDFTMEFIRMSMADVSPEDEDKTEEIKNGI